LQKITADKPDENAIFSPVSIALALALVEAGADGETKREIAHFLTPQGMNHADPNGFYQSLQKQLQIKNDKAKLTIANGLFHAENLDMKQTYTDNVKACFETEISEAPFQTNAEAARQKINQWVSAKTASKIPELFKSGSIDQATSAVLANAIYMLAAWDEKFTETEDLPFYRLGNTNQAQTVPFLSRVGKYRYGSTDSLELVELPYDDVPLSFFIILPKQRDGVKAVQQALTGDQLFSLFGQVQTKRVTLKLPKFQARLSLDLKPMLQQLGLQKMFSNQANFSRMAVQAMKVSDAVHEAYIKINENGTEAAAATGVKMVLLSAQYPPPEPVTFIADHPFIFAIVHKPTSAIVFMGKLNSVQQ